MCCVLYSYRLSIRPGAETARRGIVETDSVVSMVRKVFCTRRPGALSKRGKETLGGGKGLLASSLSDPQKSAASRSRPASCHPLLEVARTLPGRAGTELGSEGWACCEPSVPTSTQAPRSVLAAGTVVLAREPGMLVCPGSMGANSPWFRGCQVSVRNCPRKCAYLHCTPERHNSPRSTVGQIFVQRRSGMGRSSWLPCANLQSLPLRQRPLP
mmetsp:Transcript_101650/g.296349  ORF Transcript_101650/g.296349 Transcript_101650/m.296349 type:complete len:213 (+) Transcript_101650:149-787(+)